MYTHMYVYMYMYVYVYIHTSYIYIYIYILLQRAIEMYAVSTAALRKLDTFSSGGF